MERDCFTMILWLTIFGDLKMIFLIILFLFFLFFLHLFRRFYNVVTPENYQVKKVNYDDFEEGDIALVSFERVYKAISSSAFNIDFMHPVLIVEEGGEKYVIEVMDYRDKKGLHKMKLEEWVNRNKHNLILLNKMVEKEENISKKLISFTTPFLDGEKKLKKVGGFDRTWLKYVWPNQKGYKKPDIRSNKTSCNEFISYLLIESDIVGREKSVDHYHPDAFIGMKGFRTQEPFMYKDYFLCDFSIFCRR
jgi:hypothetical protein